MESLNTVRSLLRPGDFMIKIDLKDPYYVVPIYPHHKIVSEVPVQKGDLRVPVPSLWPAISPKGIYQTPETYCCSDSGQGYTDSYISA